MAEILIHLWPIYHQSGMPRAMDLGAIFDPEASEANQGGLSPRVRGNHDSLTEADLAVPQHPLTRACARSTRTRDGCPYPTAPGVRWVNHPL